MAAKNQDKIKNEDEKLGWGITLLISLLILLAGGGITAYIFYSEPGTERGERPSPGAMVVETTEVDTGNFRPKIEAMGTVKPVKDIVLKPQVGGEVIKRFSRFSSGGNVERGDTMVKIDPRDYKNKLVQQQSAYREALSQLEIEEGQQEVARRDYETLAEEIPAENKKLVLRKPQLESARARVESARAALKQARLDLRRTAVRAPFDAHVLSRNISEGSQVSAGANLGRLVGLKKFWIDVLVPVSKLRWLSFPDTPARGVPVKITNNSSWGPDEFRRGRLVRLIGKLSEKSRAARVRIQVKNPMAEKVDKMDSPPLVLGSYVRAEIPGQRIKNVVRLHRDYLREENTVWLIKNNELAIRPVEVVFKDSEYAYISRGLTGADEVIISSLATVVEGTPLRRLNEAEGKDN